MGFNSGFKGLKWVSGFTLCSLALYLYATCGTSLSFLRDVCCNVLQSTAFVSVCPGGFKLSKR